MDGDWCPEEDSDVKETKIGVGKRKRHSKVEAHYKEKNELPRTL